MMDVNKFDKLGIPMVLDTESVLINGQQYKVGFCGVVFVQRNGDWIRTDNFTVSEVEEHIDIQDLRKNKEAVEEPKELTHYMIKKIRVEGKAMREKAMMEEEK